MNQTEEYHDDLEKKKKKKKKKREKMRSRNAMYYNRDFDRIT